MAEISIQRSELFQPLFVLRDLIRDLQRGGASREVQLHPENTNVPKALKVVSKNNVDEYPHFYCFGL